MNKGSSLVEVIFIICMFACWILPPIIFGLMWWAGFFVGVGVLFGAVEILAKVLTGRTLSQKFWDWSMEEEVSASAIVYPNKKKAWVYLGCMLAGWIMLLIHLAWKMLF